MLMKRRADIHETDNTPLERKSLLWDIELEQNIHVLD